MLIGMANCMTVSNLYWAQSFLPSITGEFGRPDTSALMPSGILLGYAIGVAVLGTLATDLASRGWLAGQIVLLALSLFGAAAAGSVSVLTALCVAIGMGCSVTQRWLCIAGGLIDGAVRARAIGCIIGAGLCGIVAARAGGPGLVDAVGWRGAFAACGGMMLLTGGLAVAALPSGGKSQGLQTQDALPGAAVLWRRYALLRTAALQQAAVFAAFNLSWALILNGHAGADVSRWGLVSVTCTGACAAYLGGRLCVRIGQTRGAALGAALVFISGMLQLVSEAAGTSWMIGMSVLESGTQLALVSNHARVQALGTYPRLRGRFAAILTTIGFAGGAFGAAFGNLLAQHRQLQLGWAVAACLGGLVCVTALASAGGIPAARPAPGVKHSGSRLTQSS